ncbi:lipid kinase [Brevibacillus sp. SKDU10]|uniref:diacylglycerol kinase n=1 Tax=Brevibacillus sp. SKDU10 TaxID=1247872 RepID=UPI0007C8ECC5|nr:diacylglycerol kinase [Brevibacillus sp. SKDU10]OAJ74963.1 lipid kinase [Brevibacillus sp. SKDU10]
MKRARLIYNPTSGREAVRRQLPEILETLERAGYETSCHATKGEGDATKEAARAVSRQFDLVIAAGGDGTIYEVINGMAEKKNRPKLGIIPAGTTNDFARALGIPRSLKKASQIIAAGHTQKIDVGKMNDRYFINIAGGGTLTELTYEVPSKLKTVVGQLAYYLKGIEKLPFITPTHIRIETRNQVMVDEEVMLFLISNSNSVGGFEKIAPAASLSDGKLDCIVLKKATLPEIVRIVTMAIKGDHIKDPHVLYFQADYIKATTRDKQQVLLNLDGELGGELPCECYTLANHFEIFVP